MFHVELIELQNEMFIFIFQIALNVYKWYLSHLSKGGKAKGQGGKDKISHMDIVTAMSEW